MSTPDRLALGASIIREAVDEGLIVTGAGVDVALDAAADRERHALVRQSTHCPVCGAPVGDASATCLDHPEPRTLVA